MKNRSTFHKLNGLITLTKTVPFIFGYTSLLTMWAGYSWSAYDSLFLGLGVFVISGLASFILLDAGAIHRKMGWTLSDYKWIKAEVSIICESCNNPLNITQTLEREEGNGHHLSIKASCPFCGNAYETKTPVPSALNLLLKDAN